MIFTIYGLSDDGGFIMVSGMSIYYGYTKNLRDYTIKDYLSNSSYFEFGKCNGCHDVFSCLFYNSGTYACPRCREFFRLVI